jgi:hypothetical protein
LLSYDLLSKKILLFKSFTGITLQEFDDIYNKEIVKRYDKHELQCLSSKRKDFREREIGAVGRPFKLDIKDRFLMLLVYFHLYIIYTLSRGFLFNLDQSNSCSRDIQKIEPLLIRNCLPIPQKIYIILQKDCELLMRLRNTFLHFYLSSIVHRTAADSKTYK